MLSVIHQKHLSTTEGITQKCSQLHNTKNFSVHITSTVVPIDN